MALKDLITDLSNFKYTDYGNAGSNQSQIEGRHGTIDAPIDNSDFDNGVGAGVDPNSTPQSFNVRGYTITGNKRFIVNYGGGIMENQGSIFNDFQTFDEIAGLGGGAPYYGNLSPITPRQSIYRDDSGNYQTPREGGNTLPPGGVSNIRYSHDVQTTLNIDGSTFSNTPFIPNAQGSNFMVTPLGDTSYSNPSDSLTLDVGGISFNNEPLIPNAQGSNFMVTPLGDTSFSNPSDSLTLNVGGVTFNNSPFIPNAQGSNFLVTPIGNTSFSNPSDSITFDLAGGINTTPFIPNAQGSDFMVTPIGDTNLPSDTLTHNVGMINLTGPTTQTYQTSINVEPSSPNAHGSDFFTTPLENYTSQFSIDNLNTNINSGFDRNSMYISGIDEPNTPVFNQFTRGDSSLNVIGLNSPNFNPFEFQNGLPYVIPQHNSTGPTQFTISDFDNTPKVGNAHGSDFFTTPLENYTSQFSSDNYQTDINSGFDRTLMYISDIDEPNTPVFNQFTRGDGSLSVISFGVLGDSSPNFDPFTFGTGLPYVIPQHISTGPTQFNISGFDDTKLIDNLHGSDFMTRPSFGSQISTDTSTHDVGLVTSTHPSGIGVANITTLDTTQRFSNAHSSTNSIGGLNIDANSTIYQNMDSILNPGSNYLNLGVNNSGGVGPSRDFNTSNFYITDQSRPSVWQDDQFLNFTKSDISIKTIDFETKLINESSFDILNPLDSLNNAISGQESWDFPTDRLPYTLEFEGTNFPGLTPDHPIIIRDIGQTYGILGEGIKTNRALVDQQRIAKVLLTASGVRFIANQQLHHTFNPRKETRLYNPLSMNVSSFPMIRQNRHIGGTYENEGIDFGETSILTQYANALTSDLSVLELGDVTLNRVTPAHTAGMVPSRGGKPQLGGLPEIKLSGDYIESLDPAQWKTSQITDGLFQQKFYPFGGGYSMIPNLFERTGEGRYYVRLTGTSGYSTEDEVDTISSLVLPKYFYGDQDGDQSESSLFKIKKSYLGVSDGTLGTTALNKPGVFQGNLFPGGTKSKDNWYYPNHNTIGSSPVDKTLTISQGDTGHTDEFGMVATKQTIFFDQDGGGVDLVKTRGLDLSFGDRIINQQFKGNLYNTDKRYESNPERFEKSPDNTQRKFLGFFASIGVNKNIIYKNKFGPDESNITVNGEPILVTTKLDITAPKVNETKWKKLNQYRPESEPVGDLGRLLQSHKEKRMADGKVNPTSIFFSDTIKRLNEPAVEKLTYRSDNPSLETTQPIFNNDGLGPVKLTEFRLIGNGQGGNQGPEGQALGFLNRDARRDKHGDSRLGPKLKRSGFGPKKQDEIIKENLESTINGQQKPISPKEEIGKGELPTDIVFNAIQHNVEDFQEAGLGATKREAKFPAAVVKNDGDVLNRYRTLAYGDLPQSAASDTADTRRYENQDKDEDTLTAASNGDNTAPSVTFETRPGVGRIRLLNGSLSTDKTDNVNLVPYGRDNDSDYIPFKFYDMNNDKHIVFRATLSGISDSYSPEWSSQRYIGRPDNVHVYQGVSRELSFDFVVAPFSKQEMLVCWEKLNYLAGLTYPTWKKIGNTSRMDAPFTALTIGNMFSKTPGYINSLSYTIEDNVSWDIDKNNQVPQVVNVSVTFTHIGRHKLASQGKHYDLPWLKSLESGTEPYTYKISNKHENDGGIFGGLPDGEVIINQVRDQDTVGGRTSAEGSNAAIDTNLGESGAVPDGTGTVTMGDGITTPMLIQDNY